MNYKNFKSALLDGIKKELGLRDSDIIHRWLSGYPIEDEAYVIQGYVLYPNYLYYIYENNDAPIEMLVAQAVRGIKDKQREDTYNAFPVGEKPYREAPFDKAD